MKIGQKNVDFLLMATFWTCLIFYDPDFTYNHDRNPKDPLKSLLWTHKELPIKGC